MTDKKPDWKKELARELVPEINSSEYHLVMDAFNLAEEHFKKDGVVSKNYHEWKLNEKDIEIGILKSNIEYFKNLSNRLCFPRKEADEG